MFRLLLIRAGVTDFVRAGRVVGQLDIPLSDEGREQAKQIAQSIAESVAKDAGVPVQAVYTSRNAAAAETAQLLAQATQSKLKHFKQLSNLNQGLWQGKTIEDIKSQFPTVYRRWQENPETIRPPEGETLADAIERVNEVITKIAKRTKDGVIAVVVAEPLASILCAVLKREGYGDLWKTDSNCGQWELIEVPELPKKITANA